MTSSHARKRASSRLARDCGQFWCVRLHRAFPARSVAPPGEFSIAGQSASAAMISDETSSDGARSEGVIRLVIVENRVSPAPDCSVALASRFF